jgi:hypothetical protein
MNTGHLSVLSADSLLRHNQGVFLTMCAFGTIFLTVYADFLIVLAVKDLVIASEILFFAVLCLAQESEGSNSSFLRGEREEDSTQMVRRLQSRPCVCMPP